MLCWCGFAAKPVAVVTVQGKTIVDGHIVVNRGETVQFYGSASSDADGDSLQFYWTFGDGGDPSAAKNPKHRYRNAGSYAVRLIVSDVKDSFPLLTGQTPASYTLPSGWSLVRAQNFETGSINSDETTYGSITTDKPHSGTRSNKSRVSGDDCATGWRLNQGVATGSEIYASWYEFIDDFGKNNDEMFIFYIRKNFTNPVTYLGNRWQYLNNTGVWSKLFNIDSGQVTLFCEGNASGATPSTRYNLVSKWTSIGAGNWRQWEVYYRPATGGLQNGETMVYINGILQSHVKDTAFNGTVDMSGASITLGGTTYTKITWWSKPELTCATQPSEIDTSFNRPKDFNNPCACPNQCPPSGFVPIFYRYLDDVIILQRN